MSAITNLLNNYNLYQAQVNAYKKTTQSSEKTSSETTGTSAMITPQILNLSNGLSVIETLIAQENNASSGTSLAALGSALNLLNNGVDVTAYTDLATLSAGSTSDNLAVLASSFSTVNRINNASIPETNDQVGIAYTYSPDTGLELITLDNDSTLDTTV
jgi:hypothetical protein